GNTIGGANAAARNVISGNALAGIYLLSAGVNNTVQNNYIGINAAGSAAVANGRVGVQIQNVGNQTPLGNVISGNAGDGLKLLGATGNQVRGNIVGLGADGVTTLGNVNGIAIQADGNTIGGPAVSDRNIISGNTNTGVSGGGVGNVVRGNYIGTDAGGTLAR